MIAESPLRLNLGGAGEGYRNGKIPGFKTVDLRQEHGTDIVADVKDLSFCQSDSVDQIYASNILEHFPHRETVKVLKEWHRVLVPRGKLYLSVPDFDACVRLYKRTGLVDWVRFLIWGDQAHPLNFHYINFTYETLKKNAEDAGFSQIERVKHLPFGIDDASELIDNIECKAISLNCVLTK